MPRYFSGLWRNRDFLKLWTAKTISDFGSLVSGAAFSFTAILLLKATPAQLGLLVIANLLPKFLVGLMFGVWADRLRRLPMMILADLGRALLLGTIPLAALLGVLRIEHLYLVALLTGLLTLCFDIADRSYLPTLVPPQALVEANSKLTATSSAAEFGAFSLAGWLVQWLTGPIAVLVDAVSFLFSALFLSRIRRVEPPPAPQEQKATLWKELVEGLQAVWRHPVLAALALSTLLLGLTWGVLGTVIVAFMVRDLGFAPGVLGMIWAVGGLTSLLGALAAGPMTRRIGTGPTLITGLFLAGVGVLAVPLAHGRSLLSAALLVANQVITDSAYTLYEINQVSLRQAVTPEPLRGRVNATLEFVSLGATLLGALLGGWLGAKLGLRAALWIGAGGSFLAALGLWLSPVRQVREIPDGAEEG